jgi:acyl-CoA synthetase (AMP-forming)/AMP-acid ligase II
VADAAVVGVASQAWGETPAAFVVRRLQAPGDGTPTPEELLRWANQRLGKTQRLSYLEFIDELPRSAIGKVLKRELRERFAASASAAAATTTGVAARAADGNAGGNP